MAADERGEVAPVEEHALHPATASGVVRHTERHRLLNPVDVRPARAPREVFGRDRHDERRDQADARPQPRSLAPPREAGRPSAQQELVPPSDRIALS